MSSIYLNPKPSTLNLESIYNVVNLFHVVNILYGPLNLETVYSAGHWILWLLSNRKITRHWLRLRMYLLSLSRSLSRSLEITRQWLRGTHSVNFLPLNFLPWLLARMRSSGRAALFGFRMMMRKGLGDKAQAFRMMMRKRLGWWCARV